MYHIILLLLLSLPLLSAYLYRRGVMVEGYRMDLWCLAGALFCCTPSLYPSTCFAIDLLDPQPDIGEAGDFQQTGPPLPFQPVQQVSQPLQDVQPQRPSSRR